MRTRLLIWLIAGVAVIGALAGCSYSQVAAQPVVSASSGQFEPAATVSVSQGSTNGPEIGDGQQLWWLNSATVQLAVTNNTTGALAVTVLGTVKAPPCASTGTLSLTPPGAAAISITLAVSGQDVAVPVHLDGGQRLTVPVSISGSGCRAGADPRTFYAGLFNLRTQGI